MNNSNIALKRHESHSNAFIFGGGILIKGNLFAGRKKRGR
ncbi:hypothetical protein [Salmonella phage Tennessee]